jgi:hypothetical protein
VGHRQQLVHPDSADGRHRLRDGVAYRQKEAVCESPTGLRAQRLRTTLPYITVVVVVSVVIRAVSALPVRNPTAHLTPGEAWFWVAVFAVLLVIQSATLSLQEGVETAYADADRPSS